MGEHDAAGAEGGGEHAGLDDAAADAAGGLVAAARGHGEVLGKAGPRGRVRREATGDFGPLERGGHEGGVDVQHAHQVLTPTAVAHVEQERAGGVGDVGGELAGEDIADVVLRKQDLGHARVVGGLLVAEPEDLGRGEASERGVADHLDQPALADALGDGVALRGGSLVAPEQGRADDAAVGIEEDGAVHLTGQTERLHVADAVAEGVGDAGEGLEGGFLPVGGVLLRPAGAGGVQRVLDERGRDERAGFVDRDGLGAACADIES